MSCVVEATMLRSNGKSRVFHEPHRFCEALPPISFRPSAAVIVTPPPGTYTDATLLPALLPRLQGRAPLPPTAAGGPQTKVIWVENGDEVLVHLDSLGARILDGMLLVSADLETDQTGRATLVVALAIGKPGDPAGLIATTDELPRGNGLLASRWGRTLQEAVWAGLLSIAGDVAADAKGVPAGMTAVKGQLTFLSGQAITITVPESRP